MKILVIQFPDSQDVQIKKGMKTVTVTSGTVSASGGEVLAYAEVEDPTPAIAPHTHNVSGAVTGETSQPNTG